MYHARPYEILKTRNVLHIERFTSIIDRSVVTPGGKMARGFSKDGNNR